MTQNDTAFWADAETRYLDFDLLSTPIQVKATPVKYEWDFGDGTTDTTSSPGTEPPSLEDAKFTHVYSDTGTVNVTLNTIYNGMFSVDGGPWLMISGQARVPSETLELEVYRYHKYLVEDDCLENPDGPDCKVPTS